MFRNVQTFYDLNIMCDSLSIWLMTLEPELRLQAVENTIDHYRGEWMKLHDDLTANEGFHLLWQGMTLLGENKVGKVTALYRECTQIMMFLEVLYQLHNDLNANTRQALVWKYMKLEGWQE